MPVLSIRLPSNFEAWLTHIANGFLGGQPELIRLVLQEAVCKQMQGNPPHILSQEERLEHGGSEVVGIRLPEHLAGDVRDCAEAQIQGVSTWCCNAFAAFLVEFSQAEAAIPEDERDAFLRNYSLAYRLFIEHLLSVRQGQGV